MHHGWWGQDAFVWGEEEKIGSWGNLLTRSLLQSSKCLIRGFRVQVLKVMENVSLFPCGYWEAQNSGDSMPSMDPSRATVADEITVVVGTEDCTLCATEAEGGITDCCTACLRCTGGAEERIVSF